ncbi:putative mitochondrial protein [Cardamine amara subsp. amara]|uniref:Mitochondrial protein n=1 Tax=Cardamine amara subsp. amara TaxID=228776 RepID=A0ABD1A1B3_CARAN
MEAGENNRPSYAWRSILHGWELLQQGLIHSIGNGQNTDVWLDRWVLDGSPRRRYNRLLTMDLNLTVASLITVQGTWNKGLLSEFLHHKT